MFFRDITQRKKADEKIRRKTEQLDIIAEMNTELLNSSDWSKVIEKVFAKVGQCIKADRVYYFQNSVNEITGELESTQRLEWSSGKVAPQINNPKLQDIPLSDIQELVGPLTRKKRFMAIVGEMQDTVTKRLLFEQDIKSVLALPIFVNKTFWGFIGFDDCHSERDWDRDDISFLKTITNNLSTAIETSMTNKELEHSYKELNKSKRIYQDLFDFSPQPMWIFDPQTLYFLNVNKAAITKYGYTLEEFKEMTIRDIRSKSQIGFLEKYLEESNKNDRDSYAGVFLHTLKSGETINVEIYSNDIEYGGRTVRLVLASDITEKQEYISTIETQNKKLRDIAWTQSHVVRAPLSRLLGVINLLQLEPDDSDDVPFLLEQVKLSGEELDNIVQKIVAETRSMDIKTEAK